VVSALNMFICICHLFAFVLIILFGVFLIPDVRPYLMCFPDTFSKSLLVFPFSKVFQRSKVGTGCNLAGECLLCRCEAIGWITSTTEQFHFNSSSQTFSSMDCTFVFVSTKFFV
jgi:hypothetical protein